MLPSAPCIQYQKISFFWIRCPSLDLCDISFRIKLKQSLRLRLGIVAQGENCQGCNWPSLSKALRQGLRRCGKHILDDLGGGRSG